MSQVYATWDCSHAWAICPSLLAACLCFPYGHSFMDRVVWGIHFSMHLGVSAEVPGQISVSLMSGGRFWSACLCAMVDTWLGRHRVHTHTASTTNRALLGVLFPAEALEAKGGSQGKDTCAAHVQQRSQAPCFPRYGQTAVLLPGWC
jgi:hypothetical protein